MSPASRVAAVASGAFLVVPDLLRFRFIQSRRIRFGEEFCFAGAEPYAVDRVVSEIGKPRRSVMDGIIYLVGLVVVVMAVLSLLGLR